MDGWSLHEYVESRPLSLIDPIGLIGRRPNGGIPRAPSGSVAPGKCRITIRCTPLIVIGATHCGIRIENSNGRREIDIGGSDGRCTFVRGPVGLWPFPQLYREWWGGEYDSSVCDCILETIEKFNSQGMRYAPIPANGCSNDNPTCNSNYATKCLLSNCGVARRSTGSTLTDPVGWNFRRTVCVDRFFSKRGRSGCGPCVCHEWKKIDDDYCGEKSVVAPYSSW